MKGVCGLFFAGKNGGRREVWGLTWGTQSPGITELDTPQGLGRPLVPQSTPGHTALCLERWQDTRGHRSRESSPSQTRRSGGLNP